MRLLAVADIHSSRRGAEAVRRMVGEEAPEVVAIAGDLTSFGPPGFALELLSSLRVASVAVPGNCDPPDVAEAISRAGSRNIDLRREVVGGVPFVGLGGWWAPPAHGSWGAGAAGPEALEGLLVEGDVLLTHIPPLGRLDTVPWGAGPGRRGRVEHAGSEELARVIGRVRPGLVISGHIHEARGMEEKGGTTFVNPGPAKDGCGALIDIYKGEKEKSWRISAKLLSHCY
ncbi:MAG: metallophosphoesterase family protein [Thermoplasmatota archaeon]